MTIPIGDGRTYCYCDGPLCDPPAQLRDLLVGYAEPLPTLLAALDEADNGDDTGHEWADAMRAGRIRVTGPRSLARALPTWNGRLLPAG